jgi:hypothetical protein
MEWWIQWGGPQPPKTNRNNGGTADERGLTRINAFATALAANDQH